jgi:putative Mn2+ efflux pump MntP
LSFLEIILIAIALGCDAFSVALCVAAGGDHKFWQTLRLVVSFGFFQFLMPIIGVLIGSSVVSFVQPAARWIAALMLVGIAIHMIKNGLEDEQVCKPISRDRTKGRSLLMLSIGTSLDALAVGLSFSLLNINYLMPCIIIGILLGKGLCSIIGEKAEIFGGIILLLKLCFFRMRK